MHPHPDGPGRDWLLPPLVGLVALLTYLAHGFHGTLTRDLAIYTYAGQQVLDGVPPYLGVLNRAGPLAHLLPALGVGAARLTGHDDVEGARALYMLFAVASVVAAYVLSRDVFRSRAAGLASAAALLCFGGFIEYATYGPREKTPMVLFLLLTLYAVAKRRWLTAGVLVSIATLTLQIAFFVGMPAILVALLLGRRREWLRSLTRVFVGGLIPLLAVVVYFVSVGAVRAFAAGFLLLNATYTRADPLLGNLDHNWSQLEKGFGPSLWVLVIGMLAVMVLSFPWLTPGLRVLRVDVAPTVRLSSFGVAAVVGLVWTLRDFDNWPDVFPLFPVAALGIGALVKLLIDRLPAKASLGVVLGWTAVALVLAVTFSLTHRQSHLLEQRRATTSMLRLLPADATILDINAPQPLVIARMTNATRYQTFSNGLDRYVDDTYPGGLPGFQRAIIRAHPTLVAVGLPRRTWVPRILAPDYVRVGSAHGWVWWAPRDLGPEKLAQLRRTALRTH